ncbi:nitrate regulatory protein [uncultured Amphritea sp.]|uniref:nitrate regulatory protein n=1 Tax=uncultured Amphritea sp. TaxID=981605 RepID=UPI00262AAF2E|nr:nitrate regulatory protein [uncultured Amphritea sp.]
MKENTVSPESFFLAAKQSEINTIIELKSMLRWVNLICEFIHQLQRERGLSNRLLVGGGEKTKQQRVEQLRLTDDAFEAMKKGLTVVHQSALEGTVSAKLLNLIASALLALEGLNRLRTDIENDKYQPVDATTSYNRLIENLLLIVFEVADHATDPEVTQGLSTLFHLIQGKELVGQERAWTVVGFARGSFAPRLCERLERVNHQQVEIFSGFQQTARPELNAALSQLESSELIADFKQMRALRDKLREGQQVNPELADTWYEKATLYIDALHALEIQAMNQILTLCDNRVDLAKRNRSAAQEQIALLTGLKTDSGEPVGSGLLNAANPSHPVQTLILEQRKQIQALTNDLQQAKEALEARKLVERAKAILKENLNLDDDAAYRTLQKSAMDQKLPIQQVALAIIEAYKRSTYR